jgi:hypothetical protein
MNTKTTTMNLGLFTLNKFRPSSKISYTNRVLLLVLLLVNTQCIDAQDYTKYKVVDKEDDSKGVCWPLVQTALTEATTNEMETDTVAIPSAGLGAGITPPRRLYTAVEVPTILTPLPAFPDPASIEIYDLVGNPLIINGTTITFTPSSVVANIANDSMGTTPGYHWVGYQSNLFQPDRKTTYVYNIFHRWYTGMPRDYHNYGGRQFNSDNSGTANYSDTTFVPNPISVSILQPVSCFGSNDAVLKANTSPLNTYTYSIDTNPAIASSTFTNVTSGTHTVFITDAFNNVYDTVITITQPPALSSSTTITNCGPYTWNTSGVSYNASGTYTNTTLVGSCIQRDTLILNITTSSVQHFFITANNFYTWPLSGLTYNASGNYNFSTAVAGCNTVNILHLTIVNAPITLVLTLDQEISCFGNNDGSIIATAFPIGNPYLYILDGGAQMNSSGLFFGLSAGTHTVCVQGSTTFTTCQTITLATPPAIQAWISATSLVSCNGVDGVLSASITGGVTDIQPYETQWRNSANILLNPAPNNFATTISNLPPGVYTLRVEDDNGCFKIVSFTLTNAPLLTVQTNFEPIKCHNGSTSLQLSANGGTGEKTFLVNGASPLPFYPSGTYTVTAIDAKNCSALQVIQILNPDPLSVENTVFACATFRWPLNGMTYTTSGIYTDTITSLNGCIISCTLNLTIIQNTSSKTVATACTSYVWNVVNANNPYTAGGIYTVTSINAAGCTQSDTLVLTIDNLAFSTKTASACTSYNWNSPAANNPYTSSGIYTVSFINGNGCIQTDSLFLTINQPSTITQSVVTNAPYTWLVNSATYSLTGSYTATYLNAFNCISTAILELTVNLGASAGVHIIPKVFLDGPFDASTALMHDSLRAKNLIPYQEPYSNPPFYKMQLGGGGNETTNASVLAVTGANAIVDWVHIELRSTVFPYPIIATKNALLQRDGDIVNCTNGTMPVYFPTIPPGNYFVCIKHRNHLGVMCASPINLQYTSKVIDFTTSANVFTKALIVNTARRVIGPYRTLWGGDANTNKNVKYNGIANDRISILEAVGFNSPNNIVFGYRGEDVNMDGKIKYNNTDNDKNYISNNTVGTATPNAIISQHTPD